MSEGPPAQRHDAPDGDPMEDLWRTYYASIFNPARLKVGAMLKEAFDAFKAREVAAWKQARDAGEEYVPSGPHYSVAPRDSGAATDVADFVVLEIPTEASQRLDGRAFTNARVERDYTGRPALLFCALTYERENRRNRSQGRNTWEPISAPRNSASTFS